MNLNSMKGFLAHERLSSTHANVGICDLCGCPVDLYFQFLKIIKSRPDDFGEFADDF